MAEQDPQNRSYCIIARIAAAFAKLDFSHSLLLQMFLESRVDFHVGLAVLDRVDSRSRRREYAYDLAFMSFRGEEEKGLRRMLGGLLKKKLWELDGKRRAFLHCEWFIDPELAKHGRIRRLNGTWHKLPMGQGDRPVKLDVSCSEYTISELEELLDEIEFWQTEVDGVYQSVREALIRRGYIQT